MTLVCPSPTQENVIPIELFLAILGFRNISFTKEHPNGENRTTNNQIFGDSPAWKTKVDDLKGPARATFCPGKMKSLMIANLVSISGFL